MSADHSLVDAWVRGWARSRGTRPPARTAYGWYVDVGLPKQRARHVVAEYESNVIRELAASAHEPWTYIKILAAPQCVRPDLPDAWEIDEPRYFMTFAFVSRLPTDRDDFTTRIRLEGEVVVCEIFLGEELASSGRMVPFGDDAVFDQIGTEERFQRRGLGRRVMAHLANEAIARGARRGVLVASIEGRALYSAIGWTTVSDLTSAVLRAPR